jgi:hypothetical protein
MQFTISICSGKLQTYNEILKEFSFSSPKNEGESPSIYIDDMVDLIKFVKEVTRISLDQAKVIISCKNNLGADQISNHIHISDTYEWTLRRQTT